jgi:beta-1,4-mannosyl-glycoprotein beta-1,4-N-acetylglucosaminyltransferase
LRYKDIYTPSCDRLHTKPVTTISDAGWHMGFMGGAQAIRHKIQMYAHQEFNIASVLEHIEERLFQKKDAIGRLYQYEVVSIDSSYPAYIVNNMQKFLSWIYIW